MSVTTRSGPARLGGPLHGRHVVVVGGGLAGIAAALECADLGARVTLLERRRRLGGLTWSFRHNGMWIDNGQHVYLACCDAYLRFLDRIGAAGDVEPPRPLDIPVLAPGPTEGSVPVTGRLSRNQLPVPLHLAGSLLRYPHIATADRLRLGRALVGLARLDLADPRLDDLTFGEWLAARGQSSNAIGAIWDLITIPTVNLPAAEASLATAAMVFKTGLLSSPGAADIGWSRVPLGRLHGERAAIALERSGVETLTGLRVGGVRPGRAGTASAARAGEEVADAGTGDRWEILCPDGPIGCDAVVVALPHEEAATVVPGSSSPSQERWPELGASGIVDVHLVFDRPVLNEELVAGYRSPIQWVFDRTVTSGLGDPAGSAAAGPASRRYPGPQYLAVSLSAADHLLGERPEVIAERTTSDLARLLPAVRNARLLDTAVTKERRATFRAAPGTASLRPPPRTRRPGLVLAGAWTSTGWPATMEGAVRSGVAAARTLATDGSGRSTEDQTESPQTVQEVA